MVDPIVVTRLSAHSKRYCRQTARSIRNSCTHQQKQHAMDDYMYCKIRPERSAAHNAEVLRLKLEKLKSYLCPVDAEQLCARGAYFMQHIAGLSKQKKLLQSQDPAATAALYTEQADDMYDAMHTVHAFMERQLHQAQGPQTRFNVLRAARSRLEAALAFPKRPGWDVDLDAFVHRKVCEGPVYGPDHSRLTAKQLNHANPDEIDLLADHYFYQKVVATWSVRANLDHIESELRSLLPQLQDELVRQSVQGRAQFYLRHMREICDVKQAQQQADWIRRSQDSQRMCKTSNDQWRLVMHSADSQHFATILTNEG
ncbi:hypothetical protein ABBQ38_006719 [Trebouxia sp. C0009 RCD-2024]